MMNPAARIAPSKNCALIVAHPGHELRVLGWLRREKPLVAVITDGSGHTGQPRMDLTTRLLHTAEARPSNFYGISSDREIYRAILEQRLDFFTGLAEQLTDLLIADGTDCVAGDAIEGYNPVHDLCRLLIDRAVFQAEHRTGHRIRNLAFPLMGAPRPKVVSPEAWQLRLDAAGLQDKLAVARAYAEASGGALVDEVADTMGTLGEAAFAEEILDVSDTGALLERYAQEKPFYETHGERQVAAGHYKFVIRYREHIAPIARSLATTS